VGVELIKAMDTGGGLKKGGFLISEVADFVELLLLAVEVISERVGLLSWHPQSNT
jgi:hypothetical protein